VETVNRAIEQLDRALPLAPQPDQLRLELKQLLVHARDLALLSEAEQKSESVQKQFKQLDVDLEAWETRFDDWVKAEGENYRIGLVKDEDAAPAASPSGASPVSSPEPPKQ
jgi:hypothetical protein